ncbi:MAG: MarR family transcriptional regulator [Acidobacteriota bacterium]|nr:MarR family transcriptional regulator [Acidobacteriota bacterium]
MKPLRVVSPLHKAMRQLSVHLGDAMRGRGMEGADGHLLAFVAAYGPCGISELRRVFGHKPSTLTGLLDRLERNGWIARSIDPGDRRSFLITATPEGARAGREARRVVEAFEKKVLSRVEARDLEGFRRVLDALGEATQIQLRKG